MCRFPFPNACKPLDFWLTNPGCRAHALLYRSKSNQEKHATGHENEFAIHLPSHEILKMHVQGRDQGLCTSDAADRFGDLRINAALEAMQA